MVNKEEKEGKVTVLISSANKLAIKHFSIKKKASISIEIYNHQPKDSRNYFQFVSKIINNCKRDRPKRRL